MKEKTAMLKIRNWHKFQHYKDRNPPWIKLHYELLSSVDWVMATDETKLLMIVCMLLGSRNDGCVPCNPEYIQKFGNLKDKPNLATLCDTGFFEDASELLATCKQGASKCLRSVSVSVSNSVSYLEGDFDAFWSAYPRKAGKKAALKAWNAAKDKPAVDVIVTAVKAQAASDQWKRDGGQFIPHPATWLNQGRWADVVEARQTAQARPAKAAALISRDSAIRDAVRALTEASATGDISRCMKALHDKYRDIPPQNGQTVAGEALEIWKFQDKQGREVVHNAPQAAI